MSPLLGGKSERAVDDHATQLAHFAVGEIAQKANAPQLSLVRVTKLSTQVVAGIKYYFDLEARDASGKARHFEAQVWEKPGGYENSAPELTGYKEVHQAPAEGGGSGAGSGSGSASGGPWAAAIDSAVAQINMRSNSLVPYVFESLVSADALGDGSGGAKLVLRVKRGGKHETVAAHVEPREGGGGGYHLNSFAPVVG